MSPAELAIIREQLHTAVQEHIAILTNADEAGFIAAYGAVARLTRLFWAHYLLLPLVAFPDDPHPDVRHAPMLTQAPALLTPTLAMLAFAPGGLRFGETTWIGHAPAAGRLFGYRVTSDEVSGRPTWPTSHLHRRTAQMLHLLFPFRAIELSSLSVDARGAEVQRITGSLNTESALFSEALTVGGSPAQMGQATKELVDAVSALACTPGGVPMFGCRWEIGDWDAVKEAAA